jgi:hypothetical protein
MMAEKIDAYACGDADGDADGDAERWGNESRL